MIIQLLTNDKFWIDWVRAPLPLKANSDRYSFSFISALPLTMIDPVILPYTNKHSVNRPRMILKLTATLNWKNAAYFIGEHGYFLSRQPFYLPKKREIFLHLRAKFRKPKGLNLQKKFNFVMIIIY
jgi:hypothetical protein